jgi:hypothetical protein
MALEVHVNRPDRCRWGSGMEERVSYRLCHTNELNHVIIRSLKRT